MEEYKDFLHGHYYSISTIEGRIRSIKQKMLRVL